VKEYRFKRRYKNEDSGVCRSSGERNGSLVLSPRTRNPVSRGRGSHVHIGISQHREKSV